MNIYQIPSPIEVRFVINSNSNSVKNYKNQARQEKPIISILKIIILMLRPYIILSALINLEII